MEEQECLASGPQCVLLGPSRSGGNRVYGAGHDVSVDPFGDPDPQDSAAQHVLPLVRKQLVFECN